MSYVSVRHLSSQQGSCAKHEVFRLYQHGRLHFRSKAPAVPQSLCSPSFSCTAKAQIRHRSYSNVGHVSFIARKGTTGQCLQPPSDCAMPGWCPARASLNTQSPEEMEKNKWKSLVSTAASPISELWHFVQGTVSSSTYVTSSSGPKAMPTCSFD